MVDIKTVGKNIKKYRCIKKITQEDLAERTGKTSQYISIIESGNANISVSLLVKIAAVLGIHPSLMLDNKDENPCDDCERRIKYLTRDCSEKEMEIICALIQVLLRNLRSE